MPSAFHLLLMDAVGKALACGRLHLAAPGEAQVRYMAVDEHVRGCGYGSRILDALEVRSEAVATAKSCLGRVITPLNSTVNAATP
jgi:N-acetylglutamate synthase-like GNAT family acetyltransferase